MVGGGGGSVERRGVVRRGGSVGRRGVEVGAVAGVGWAVVGVEWWSAGGRRDRSVTSSQPRDLSRCSSCAASLVPHASAKEASGQTAD